MSSNIPRDRSSRRKPANTTASATPLKNSENLAPAGARLILDTFGTELEQKYNIEGSNVLDIVHARLENDEANDKLKKQAIELENMQRELAAFRAAATTQAGTAEPALPTAQADDGEEAEIADALAKEKAENAKLKQLLAAARAAGAASSANDAATALQMIDRPAGTAGTHFNIQDAMGLGMSGADGAKYKAMQRFLQELTARAGVNWEIPWSKISAETKGKLFAAARERHPFLARFHNDWATEEIVKQYISNKRNNAYRNGWLDVPPQYAHLKANAAHRDPDAPRGRKKKLEKVKHAARKNLKKPAAAAKASSSKSTGAGTKNKGKGKKDKKKMVDSEEEDEGMEVDGGGNTDDSELTS